jgi:hypothetical protein
MCSPGQSSPAWLMTNQPCCPTRNRGTPHRCHSIIDGSRELMGSLTIRMCIFFPAVYKCYICNCTPLA